MIQNRNITDVLPVPVYRETDFTPKRVDVLCLHDTVARFRTGVKFSPHVRTGTRTGVNSSRGDSRRPGILWWYHVNKYRAMRGNRSELAPRRTSPRCHVNTPLGKSWLYPNYDRLAPFSLFRCFFLYVPLTTRVRLSLVYMSLSV